jgi:hypothetical protein
MEQASLLKRIYRKLLPLRLRKAIGFTLTLPKQIYVFIVFLLTNWRKFKYELSIAAIVRNETVYTGMAGISSYCGSRAFLSIR